jgi:hypothetical protein
MRQQSFVQEHHLEEAVRRKVIHDGQLQEILAISRAMGQGGPTADLGWLSIAQAVLAAAVVGISALFTFTSHDARDRAGPLLGVSVAAVVVLLGATVGLRRVGALPALSGITAAGAALWSWGVGTAIHGMARLQTQPVEPYGDAWRAVQRLVVQGSIVGFATVLVVSLVVGFALRAPTAAAIGAFCFVMMTLRGLELSALDEGSSYPEMLRVMVLFSLAAALFVAGFAADWKTKSTRFDPACWLHTAGLFPLAAGAAAAIDRHAPLTLPMTVLAACTLAAGVWADRKTVIFGGALALFAVVPFGAASAAMGGELIAVAFATSTVLVFVALVWTRRVYLARARTGIVAPERTVWG